MNPAPGSAGFRSSTQPTVWVIAKQQRHHMLEMGCEVYCESLAHMLGDFLEVAPVVFREDDFFDAGAAGGDEFFAHKETSKVSIASALMLNGASYSGGRSRTPTKSRSSTTINELLEIAI